MKYFIDCTGVIYTVYEDGGTNHPIELINTLNQNGIEFVELILVDGMVVDTYVLHKSLIELDYTSTILLN